MENVVAVIVTYNRLELLKQAIGSVKQQTYPLKHIIVINNGSTDDTAAWLNTQPGLNCLHTEKNSGASGGFYAGIKMAADLGTPWIWVMDDDTICEEAALERLVVKASVIGSNLGFIGSRCNWCNGEPHLMNVPDIKPRFQKNLAFNYYDQHDLYLTTSSSWVSLLLNAEAVKAVGLPYKDFFFWSDDLEYTQRITRHGYLGFYCPSSIVLHKTAKNYCPDFYNETVNNLWKYQYGFRNEFFLKRKEKGIIYFIFWLMAKVSYTSVKLLKTRKDNHLKCIAVLLRSAMLSVFFDPQIDRLL